MSAHEGGEADGGWPLRPDWGGCWRAEGNPAKLKLCLMRGGLCAREDGGGGCAALEEDEKEEEREKGFSSSPLWTKWQRTPYGQKPMVWNVRHGSVLYLGCLFRSRSSSAPCANWHFPPYLQKPLSLNDRHSSVL